MKRYQFLLDDKKTWEVCYIYQTDAIKTFYKFCKYPIGFAFKSVKLNAFCEIIAPEVMLYDFYGYRFYTETATKKYIKSFWICHELLMDNPYFLKLTRNDGSSTLLFDGNNLPTKKK